MQLDQLDLSILRSLLEDARLSFRELAHRVDSTTPTVSARVKTLEGLGIIQGYRMELNPDVLGGPLRILRARCRPQASTRIAAALAAAPGVERVDVLAGGQVDARFRERLHDGVRAPHEILSQDADVTSYEIAEVLATPRSAPTTLGGGHIEVPCHQCKGPIHGAPIRGKFEGRQHVFCCAHCLQTFKGRVEAAAKSQRAAPTTRRTQVGHQH